MQQPQDASRGTIRFLKFTRSRDGTFVTSDIVKDEQNLRRRQACIMGIFKDDNASILQGLGYMSTDTDEHPVYPEHMLDRLCDLVTFPDPDVKAQAWRVLNFIVSYESRMGEYLLREKGLFGKIPEHGDCFSWLEMIGNLLNSSESCRRYIIDDIQAADKIVKELRPGYCHLWEKAFVTSGLALGVGICDRILSLVREIVGAIDGEVEWRDLSHISMLFRTLVEVDPKMCSFLVDLGALERIVAYEKRRDDTVTNYCGMFTYMVHRCPQVVEYLVSSEVRLIPWIASCIESYTDKDSDDDVIVHDMIELLADVVDAFRPAQDLVGGVLKFIMEGTDNFCAHLKESVLRLLFTCLFDPNSAVSHDIVEHHIMFIFDGWQLIDRDHSLFVLQVFHNLLSAVDADTHMAIASYAQSSPQFTDWMETIPNTPEAKHLSEDVLRQLT